MHGVDDNKDKDEFGDEIDAGTVIDDGDSESDGDGDSESDGDGDSDSDSDSGDCQDKHQECTRWSNVGECDANPCEYKSSTIKYNVQYLPYCIYSIVFFFEAEQYYLSQKSRFCATLIRLYPRTVLTINCIVLYCRHS